MRTQELGSAVSVGFPQHDLGSYFRRQKGAKDNVCLCSIAHKTLDYILLEDSAGLDS